MSGRSPAGRGGGALQAARRYRTVRTQPVVFSTVDPHALFYGNNVLWKTIDGGINWKQISPDLTRKTWDVPKNVGKYTRASRVDQRGAIGAQVIYTIGPSYRDINRIWIGTDDGVIATTADGGLHWTDVTPKQLTAFMKVFIIDPGRFDPLTAYAAVNTLRLDDMNPHIYPHARRRQDVDGNRQRHPRRRAGQRRPRGSEAQGPALRRIGNAGLRVVRRRRSLAVAAPEHGRRRRCAIW